MKNKEPWYSGYDGGKGPVMTMAYGRHDHNITTSLPGLDKELTEA